MNWRDLADTVNKFAPGVGASLGGPMGAAVGAVMAAAVGKGDTPTPDSVYKAIQEDPGASEIIAKLDIKRIEQQIVETQAELEDRDAARQLQIAALNQGKGEFQNWLAAGVLLGGAVMLAAVAFTPMDTLSDNVRMFILGFLTAAMTQVLNYFFGSTQWGNRNARTDSFPVRSGGIYSRVEAKDRR